MDGDIESNHSGVVSGVLIQLLNPKGWVASLTVFTQFINPANDYVSQVATIISVMVGIGVLCMLVWAYFGTMLQKLLQSPKQMRVINGCLGGSLAIVAVMMLGQAG
ncbi:transporter, lysE family [Vibrio ishigakensis]|nr:transporter, lysE family [Vibrio ishigakensis]